MHTRQKWNIKFPIDICKIILESLTLLRIYPDEIHLGESNYNCRSRDSIVPISTGKIGVHFPFREFCTHWKSQGISPKILEKRDF